MAVQILDKAFQILETLSNEWTGLSVSALSEDLGINISTVHRILSSFISRGYVVQTDTKKNKLSLKFIDISSSYLNGLELKSEAHRLLNSLAAKLNQTIFLATLIENQVVYIDKHELFSSFRKYAIIGERRPLYCTALGKSLLLGFDDKALQEYMKETEFRKYTDNTILDKEGLLKDLKVSGMRGWTIDNEEVEDGVICYGVPIYDYRGQIIAAMSTSGFKDHIQGREEDIITCLLATSKKISQKMGYKSPYSSIDKQ